MHLNRITHPSHPMYPAALQLYRGSFPAHEQREPASQEKILQDRAYHFSLLYDAEIFVGLVLYWEAEDFLYIEHFCILPEMRNKRYGQKALELLQAQQKTLILEIDPPVDELSLRRKGFYERCGFTENPFRHIHPPYHRGMAGHSLVLMTCPQKISQAAFDTFRRYLGDTVMAGAFE